MTGVLWLSVSVVMEVAATMILYTLQRKTKFGQWKSWQIQLLIGLIYGGFAVISTHLPLKTNGYVLNIRDAAPIIAGLVFGPWAGLLAGVIGGVERFFAHMIDANVGDYTTVACGIATITAGVFVFLLKQFVFERKIPSYFYGFTTGGVAEVFHMLVLMLTHLNDLKTAYTVVKAVSWWMISFCAVCCLLALLAVYLLSKRFDKKEAPHVQTAA